MSTFKIASAFKFSLLLGASGLVFSAQAQETLQTSIHKLYQSPRAMGMGGAFVAVANDYSAMFYNPAGLARLENGQFNGSLDFAISGQQFAQFLQDIQDASQITDSTAQFNEIMNVLQKNYGKQYSLRTGLLQAIYARPNWSLGLLTSDLTLDLRVHNQATPAINVRAFHDTTLAFGYGSAFRHENIPGKFSWGITTKFVNRGYANKQLNALDLVVDSQVLRSSDLRDGYTYDVDLGFLYTPALASDGVGGMMRLARPTFGLVFRNLLDTGFANSLHVFNKDLTEAPEKLHRTIDFGTKFELPSFWIFGWRMVADVQDVLHPNYSLKKALHLGAEFDWTVASWWRGQYRIGANQGYPTVGASFLFTLFRLDLLSYGEDIGTAANPVENRMYQISLNLDI